MNLNLDVLNLRCVLDTKLRVSTKQLAKCIWGLGER